MEIRFYDVANDKCNTIAVNNYDEIRAVIKSELKDAKNLEFSYCWLEDGICDVCGEDEVYETDIEKMLDMAIDFFKKFNHCIFSYTELGLDGKIIRIELYTDEYLKKVQAEYNEQKAVEDFFNEGMERPEHISIVGAIQCAIKSALSGEAKSVEEAIAIAKDKWFRRR